MRSVWTIGFLLVAAGCASEAEAPPQADAPVVAASAPDGLAVPAWMVYVPGGSTLVGAAADDATAEPSERPAFRAEVETFFLDKSPVTVERFGAWADSVGFQTEAERLGDAGVYDEPTDSWRLVKGATWRTPLGPSGPPALADHPVTQVSWNDARAYCEATGGRLPTEIEWEHAARGAVNTRDPYAWGQRLRDHSTSHANTHDHDDGYTTTSPVGAFGETDLGLTDMGGNVWEWTASVFRSYAEPDAPASPSAERVQRGGSFLCTEEFCHGYRVSARSHSSPDTALYHTGFRCARSLDADV